jgi:hypothetical protein
VNSFEQEVGEGEVGEEALICKCPLFLLVLSRCHVNISFRVVKIMIVS